MTTTDGASIWILPFKAEGELEDRLLERLRWYLQDHSDAIGRERIDDVLAPILESASEKGKAFVTNMDAEIRLRAAAVEDLDSREPARVDEVVAGMGTTYTGRVLESLDSRLDFGTRDELQWASVESCLYVFRKEDNQSVLRCCMHWMLFHDRNKANAIINGGVRDVPDREKTILRQLRIIANRGSEGDDGDFVDWLGDEQFLALLAMGD